MTLTAEQLSVVNLVSGRHLVLAPPGSGKTEMLSQRIVRALAAGVDAKKMLCATFTNRAAFEMRDRVSSAAGPDCALPDVGNLHHFCHRFLLSVRRIHPGKHVLDESQQLDFIREVTDVLREELRRGEAADLKRTHGVSVMPMIKGICEPMRISLDEIVEELFADYEESDKSTYPDILSAALISHQWRMGIPSCYLRQVPPQMLELVDRGVIAALEQAYTGLKRKFKAVDFDDLINETFLCLTKNPLEDERRFDWVQIDEVQDLNPLQWRIVKELTSSHAVSVCFGDVEQSIFSFLGASASSFASAVAGCKRHYFKANFRATPLLLEILMRYSLEALRLLYVAMSRAKRHLALMDCGPGGCWQNIAECFRADYAGYYLRRARGDDLSCDWLHQWEELAKANVEGRCPMELIEPALMSKAGAIVRMALKTLRHHPNPDEARRRWLDCIESDFAETAIGCLRIGRVYDSEVIDRVRKATIASAKLRDHRAALQYFEAKLACAREHRAGLLAAIGDFVYHCNGTLRLDATTFLVDQGVVCWKGVIRGASTDFVRLQSVADDAHEETIRSILAKKLPDDYERRLRAILFARAKRKM